MLPQRPSEGCVVRESPLLPLELMKPPQARPSAGRAGAALVRSGSVWAKRRSWPRCTASFVSSGEVVEVNRGLPRPLSPSPFSVPARTRPAACIKAHSRAVSSSESRPWLSALALGQCHLLLPAGRTFTSSCARVPLAVALGRLLYASSQYFARPAAFCPGSERLRIAGATLAASCTRCPRFAVATCRLGGHQQQLREGGTSCAEPTDLRLAPSAPSLLSLPSFLPSSAPSPRPRPPSSRLLDSTMLSQTLLALAGAAIGVAALPSGGKGGASSLSSLCLLSSGGLELTLVLVLHQLHHHLLVLFPFFPSSSSPSPVMPSATLPTLTNTCRTASRRLGSATRTSVLVTSGYSRGSCALNCVTRERDSDQLLAL